MSSDEIYRYGAVNAGLLDQTFALQWVQSYIHLFGGNASQVTISGNSAGAGSVMLQAMAFGGTLGESLFSNVTRTITFTRSSSDVFHRLFQLRLFFLSNLATPILFLPKATTPSPQRSAVSMDTHRATSATPFSNAWSIKIRTPSKTPAPLSLGVADMALGGSYLLQMEGSSSSYRASNYSRSA